jgi:hypothetical protein
LWIKKPELVVEVQVMATDILLNIHPAGLREKVQKTQVEMTRALGIRQPRVAGVERPGRDLKLSILKRYVGGGLAVNRAWILNGRMALTTNLYC